MRTVGLSIAADELDWFFMRRHQAAGSHGQSYEAMFAGTYDADAIHERRLSQRGRAGGALNRRISLLVSCLTPDERDVAERAFGPQGPIPPAVRVAFANRGQGALGRLALRTTALRVAMDRRNAVALTKYEKAVVRAKTDTQRAAVKEPVIYTELLKFLESAVGANRKVTMEVRHEAQALLQATLMSYERLRAERAGYEVLAGAA